MMHDTNKPQTHFRFCGSHNPHTILLFVTSVMMFHSNKVRGVF